MSEPDREAATHALDRRDLLRGAALASGGALAWSFLGRPPTPAVASPAPAQGFTGGAGDVVGVDPTAGPAFFSDATLNFQTLFALGATAYQASEVGEIMTTIGRIQARGSTYAAFCEEFLGLGGRLATQADRARRRGHRVTAREYALRSANAYNQALFFVLALSDGPSREGPTYRLMRTQFDRAMGLLDTPATAVRIPYGRSFLPGWLLRPAGPRRRRPTIIFNNGSDAQNIDLYGWGALAAVQRGYNALMYEGPGQGSMLFLRKTPFRHDWERVVTPVVSYLRGRSDVDPRRIALWGWSMGGELVARAAAFEHRLAAVVADPGVQSVISSWPKEIIATAYDGTKAEVDAGFQQLLAGAPPALQFTLRKRLEIYRTPSWYDVVRMMQRYTVKDLVGRIQAPMLVTEPQLEQFWPGEAQLVYDGLRARGRAITRFTSAEGAQYHCEPMAPQVRNERILDWLAGPLGG